MECNIPSPSIKTGSTPEIEYVKRVLSQTAVYAHRTQCSASMWHGRYLKCLVHLAKMQSSASTLIDNRRKDLEELEEEFLDEKDFTRGALDFVFDFMIVNTSFNLSIGQIVAALGDGVIPSPELGNLNHLIGRLEDLLGSRPQPPSGRGGSSPVPGLEDVSASSSESSFWSCYSPPSDILRDSVAFSLQKVSAVLSEGNPSEPSTAVEDEVEVGDAGGVRERDDGAGGDNWGISSGGELGA
jgi:hypothetical protein